MCRSHAECPLRLGWRWGPIVLTAYFHVNEEGEVETIHLASMHYPDVRTEWLKSEAAFLRGNKNVFFVSCKVDENDAQRLLSDASSIRSCSISRGAATIMSCHVAPYDWSHGCVHSLPVSIALFLAGVHQLPAIYHHSLHSVNTDSCYHCSQTDAHACVVGFIRALSLHRSSLCKLFVTSQTNWKRVCQP